MQILDQIQIEKLGDSELMKYSQLVGASARKWKNHFIALLPEIAKRGIYKKKFSSITEFAAKVGGVGKRSVEAVFQVEKKLKDKPELKALISEVGLNKVRVVATIATKENQRELAMKVRTMTKCALEEVARNERNIGLNFSPENRSLLGQIPPGRKKDWEYLGFCVSNKNMLELRKFKLKLEREKKKRLDFNEVLEELLKTVKKKQSENPKKIIEEIPAVRKKISRYIPVAIKRELLTKYNGECAFPGCNKPSVVLHHPDRYAINSLHERIAPLCIVHHEFAHQGLIENEDRPVKEWFIRKNPDKNHIKYGIDQKMLSFKMLVL